MTDDPIYYGRLVNGAKRHDPAGVDPRIARRLADWCAERGYAAQAAAWALAERAAMRWTARHGWAWSEAPVPDPDPVVFSWAVMPARLRATVTGRVRRPAGLGTRRWEIVCDCQLTVDADQLAAPWYVTRWPGDDPTVPAPPPDYLTGRLAALARVLLAGHAARPPRAWRGKFLSPTGHWYRDPAAGWDDYSLNYLIDAGVLTTVRYDFHPEPADV